MWRKGWLCCIAEEKEVLLLVLGRKHLLTERGSPKPTRLPCSIKNYWTRLKLWDWSEHTTASGSSWIIYQEFEGFLVCDNSDTFCSSLSPVSLSHLLTLLFELYQLLIRTIAFWSLTVEHSFKCSHLPTKVVGNKCGWFSAFHFYCTPSLPVHLSLCSLLCSQRCMFSLDYGHLVTVFLVCECVYRSHIACVYFGLV